MIFERCHVWPRKEDVGMLGGRVLLKGTAFVPRTITHELLRKGPHAWTHFPPQSPLLFVLPMAVPGEPCQPVPTRRLSTGL